MIERGVWLGTIANKTCVFRIPNNYKKWDKKETESRNDGFHYAKVPAISVFTNLPLQKSTDQMVIWKPFDQKEYPAYDNYAAFECSKVANIPKDTEITATIDKDNLQGWKDTYHDDLTVMSTNNKTVNVKIDRPIWGVPITFLDKYNPSSNILQHNLAKEFDIIGFGSGSFGKSIGVSGYKEKYKPFLGKTAPVAGNLYYVIDGKPKTPYKRILIRAKKGVKF